MILILSSTNKISGAEHVLKDYLENSNLDEKITICSSTQNIDKFYRKIGKVNTMKDDDISQIEFSKNFKKILFEIFKYIKFYKRLSKLKRQQKINIGIGNNTLDSIYSFFFFKNKIPFILFIHDTICLKSYRAKMIKYLDKYTYKYIAVSIAVKNQLLKIGISNEKIEVIYNGLTINDFKEKTKNKILKIGFIGRIDYGKNPELYFKIIERIKDKNINFDSSIVYNGYDKNIYKNLQEINYRKNLNINFIYNLSREEVEVYLQKIDFLIITSRTDSLPTVILEAFKNGTPVVGIKNDGIPEMIEDGYNGFLFENLDDIDKILDKIIKLSDEEYIKMSKNSNETIYKKFRIENKVEKLDNILREVIKNEINRGI